MDEGVSTIPAGEIPDPPADPADERKAPDTPPDTPAEPADPPGDEVTVTLPQATLPPSSYPTLDGTISIVSTLSPTFVTADISTLTNSDGNPTATITNTPTPFSTEAVITTTDAQGRPITITTDILATPTTKILTDSNGTPTATQTLYPAPTASSRVLVFTLKKRDYFAGYFLPTILSSLLAIPVRTIELAAQRYYPFHELTRPHGSPASSSLLLRTGGIFGIRTTFRALRGGKLILSLSSLLVLCSAILIPLSSEAVSLKLYNADGACTLSDPHGCVMALSVFAIPARATLALLAFMVVLICGILLSLRRWVSGVAGDPWSAAAVAALCGSEGVRGVISS
ncbi:DUF3433 domain-containing protein, partial [Candidatus Bathyarchaeota archaeon]|nr:DUF3433 domain-containing protein [Candidatus Bathyarchaeota archaeon]